MKVAMDELCAMQSVTGGRFLGYWGKASLIREVF